MRLFAIHTGLAVLAGVAVSNTTIGADLPRLAQAKTVLGELIHLKVQEGMIRVTTEHWAKAAEQVTKQRRLQELTAMYQRQGRSLELAQRLAGTRQGTEEDLRLAEVELLFASLKTALDLENGGQSASGNNRQMDGHSKDAMLELDVSPERGWLMLRFIRKAPLVETLQVEDQDGRGFRLAVHSLRLSLLLTQAADGQLQVSFRAGKTPPVVVNADSLEQFRTKHASVHNRIVTALKEIGIEGLVAE